MIEQLAINPHRISLAPTFFHSGLFQNISREVPLVVILDNNIEKLLHPHLQPFFSNLQIPFRIISFPAGEKAKQWRTFLYLHQRLASYGISSSSTILAIGGGVTLDLAGFLAATYHRGMPCIFVPTTLMAMIDASIGGKNGINIQHIKNQMGTFYLPQDVWVIPSFLTTLPPQEWRNGIAEAIKHGIIVDADLWSFLQTHQVNILNDPSLLQTFLKKNCITKARVVSQDVLDHHRRNILNFGHTIGHAIETASQGKIPHGFAISIGMVLETKLSLLSRKLQNPQILEDLQNMLRAFQLPTSLTELYQFNPTYTSSLAPTRFSPTKLLAITTKDKKNKTHSPITIVGIENLGLPIPELCFSPDLSIVTQLFKEEFYALRNH